MFKFNTIEEALEDLRQGKVILVTDNEDRENEGDLICAAQFATPENINFMATHAKGLICVPMTEEDAERLQLPAMVANNKDPHGTAFTVSVDHVSNSTGISAYDRSDTATALADKDAKPSDFVRPGHMFPLVAKKWGTLVREGHTEATVDLCRLAGLTPMGICVEIMADSGEMMRTPSLKDFATQHNIKFITIEALVEHRKQTENLIRRVAITKLPTKHGIFDAHAYVSRVTGEHHVAIVKGSPIGEAVLCRIHSECLTGDAFGSQRCDCGEQFDIAIKQIETQGTGVMLYMRQEGRGIGLVEKLKAYELQDQGLDTVEANLALGHKEDLREYHLAAQILKDLGIKSVRLLTNNPLKINELTAQGVTISERVPIEMPANEHDKQYLITKKEKMGHILDKL